jgi:hypothetical protein
MTHAEAGQRVSLDRRTITTLLEAASIEDETYRLYALNDVLTVVSSCQHLGWDDDRLNDVTHAVAEVTGALLVLAERVLVATMADPSQARPCIDALPGYDDVPWSI